MTEPAPPSSTQRFFGGLLMAVGVLMTVACGLCSLVALVAFSTTGNGEDILMGLVTVSIVGGVPTAIGVGLFVAGRALRRP